jgi:hypothetical protein
MGVCLSMVKKKPRLAPGPKAFTLNRQPKPKSGAGEKSIGAELDRAATALRKKFLEQFCVRRDSSALHFYQSMKIFHKELRVMWLHKHALSHRTKPEFDEDDLHATRVLRGELGQHLKLFCPQLPALMTWFVENLCQLQQDIVWIEFEAEKIWPMIEKEYPIWIQVACYGSPARRDWQAPGWLKNWPADLTPKALLSAARGGRLNAHRTAEVLKEIRNRVEEKLAGSLSSALGEVCIQIVQKKQAARHEQKTTPPNEKQIDGDRLSSLQGTKHKQTESVSEIFSHSEDYATIKYRGKVYFFTRRQAHVVKQLHEAYKAGTPGLSHRTILASLESETSRLVDTFKNHSAWRNLIIPVKGRRGIIRLNLADPSKREPSSIKP